LDTVHDDGEGLEERAFGEGYCRGELVAPFRWVGLITLESAVVRVDASKLDIFAEVVAAVHAEEAGAAGDARFDGYTVAWMLVSHDPRKVEPNG
jgi:hypothetical protein